MRNYRRANNRRAHYDPISDSVTPMSQSELAAEAEAVFDIVFDEDPKALSQSGAYSKIFDYFKRYGISNDYSDAVDMAIYIEENLLRHSRRANRRANRGASLKVSYSKEDEFEVHDEVVEKFPGGEGALADLFGYTNLDQAEINSAKVMPYIEDAVFSRGGDRDDVDFAYDNLEYFFQTEY